MAKVMARLNTENIVVNMESWDNYATETDTLKNLIGNVAMGDTFNSEDGRFYRNGEIVKTDSERLADAEAEVEAALYRISVQNTKPVTANIETLILTFNAAKGTYAYETNADIVTARLGRDTIPVGQYISVPTDGVVNVYVTNSTDADITIKINQI